MILHWTIASLIALNFVLIWTSEDLPRPERMQLMANHRAVGITVLLLSLLRLAWRLTHRYPELRQGLHMWEKALTRFVHTAFYVLMIGMPLTGWMMSSSRGPVSVFGVFAMPALPVGEAAGDLAHDTHELLGTVMLVLVALHVLGALKHHFVDRDGTLGRMIPFVRGPA